jgi:RHH-type rel operon transcriptional repressor/antitoxin RelB
LRLAYTIIDECLFYLLQYDIHVYQKEITMLAIRLPQEIEIRLDNLAKLTGRTKTFYVREAILEHLDDLEDVYLSDKRLMDLNSGKTKTIPLKEVMKKYGLES